MNGKDGGLVNRKLCETRLKTGEKMEVHVVTAPDEEYEGGVFSLLRHKGEIWQWHMKAAFRGETGQLQSRFYLGIVDGRIISNVSTWEHGPTGILAHVFTVEDQRRKGACKAIMAALMEDFLRRGGRILTLGTGYGSPPYYIYKSFGFRSMTEGSGSMRYDADPGFEEEFFSWGNVRLRELDWQDWSILNLLFAVQDGSYLRNLSHGIFWPTNYEGSFLQDLKGRLERSWRANILESERGAIVGYATLIPDSRWRNQVWLLDLFLHPRFESHAIFLLEAMDWPKEKVQCYVETDLSWKIDALSKLGFRKEATFSKQIRKEDEALDVFVMERPAQ